MRAGPCGGQECVAHAPCLGLAHAGFLLWSSSVLGPQLAAVMWHQMGLSQLLALHLLLVQHSPEFLFHSGDAHYSRSPFSPLTSNEFLLAPFPPTASWAVGHKNPEGGKCGCKDTLWSSSRDALCNGCISYIIFYKQTFIKQGIKKKSC